MSRTFFNNITIQLIANEDATVCQDLQQACVFFRNAFALQLDRAVGSLQEDAKKDSSLGELWSDIKSSNGGFDVNLAAELPYHLPIFEEKPDYSVKMGCTELFVSTRMVRCFEAGDTATSSLRYWLAHRLAIPALKARKGLKEIHPIPLNTFIAKRMFVKARSAESAIGDNFYSWVEDMTHEISLLVDAIRTVSPTENRHLLPLLTVNSFPMFFLAISGEKNKTGAEQFLPDLRQTRFQSLSRLKHADLMNLQSHLNSQLPIPIEDYSLGLAETFLHHGYADLAVVQVCVACESVLSRCYREYLLTRGVSKSRFEDSERDITYSSLLNLHLASMCNLSELADHENTLSRLNWARQRRNEIVHRGRVQKRASTEEIEAAITAAGKLVMFLSQKGTEQVSAMSS